MSRAVLTRVRDDLPREHRLFGRRCYARVVDGHLFPRYDLNEATIFPSSSLAGTVLSQAIKNPGEEWEIMRILERGGVVA